MFSQVSGRKLGTQFRHASGTPQMSITAYDSRVELMNLLEPVFEAHHECN